MAKGESLRYKNVSPDTVWIRRLHLSVEAGAEFESDVEINDAKFQRVTEPQKKGAGDSGKED